MFMKGEEFRPSQIPHPQAWRRIPAPYIEEQVQRLSSYNRP